MDIFDLFKKLEKPTPTGPVEYIVVGLGNPGKDYQYTRHNAGFLAVDHIAEKLGFKVDKIRFKSLCGEAMIRSKRVLFLKPSTYMNLSGQAVTEAMAFYKVPTTNVIVIYDDVSLDVGRLRIRAKGSDGGHNGIKNIIYLTAKDDFPRIKLGVGGKPHPDYDMADWVLSRFSDEEMKALGQCIQKTPDILDAIIGSSVADAMNQFNSK